MIDLAVGVIIANAFIQSLHWLKMLSHLFFLNPLWKLQTWSKPTNGTGLLMVTSWALINFLVIGTVLFITNLLKKHKALLRRTRKLLKKLLDLQLNWSLQEISFVGWEIKEFTDETAIFLPYCLYWKHMRFSPKIKQKQTEICFFVQLEFLRLRAASGFALAFYRRFFHRIVFLEEYQL